jgi:hypothetical protein
VLMRFIHHIEALRGECGREFLGNPGFHLHVF